MLPNISDDKVWQEGRRVQVGSKPKAFNGFLPLT
jgi:hypothetical protein